MTPTDEMIEAGRAATLAVGADPVNEETLRAIYLAMSQASVSEDYCGIVVMNEEDTKPPVSEDQVERVARVARAIETADHMQGKPHYLHLARAAIHAMPDEGLREALEKLVAKLDECAPHITGAFHMAAIHGCEYSGPTYEHELKQARQALMVD